MSRPLSAAERADTLSELRARFAAPRVGLGRLPTGLEGLDQWLGGWPSPGLTELVGAPGSGRLAPILPLLRSLLRRGRTVVWVDPLHQLHPPGLGAELVGAPTGPGGLVLLRPPGDQAAWAAEQVARSGAADALVMLDLPRLGRAGLRLGRACEGGNSVVFVVGEESEPELPAALRLRSEGWEDAGLRLRCTRARDGRMVGERVLSMIEGQVEAVRTAPRPVKERVERPARAETPRPSRRGPRHAAQLRLVPTS